MDRPAALLTDAFERVRDLVREVLDGADSALVHARVDADANSIAWLVWHLARVEDDHLAGVAGREQVWTEAGFADRFGLPFGVEEIGYGQSSDEVAQVRVDDPRLLVDYYDAVHERTREILAGLTDADYDRVVDEHWDPPVTAAVRLVSVVGDVTQHVGQAAFVRGMLERATS
ncbi:MAG: DinB family protein [Micrococcales bacterium]|nr:DinB family protein [Micrococcales bacterium]